MCGIIPATVMLVAARLMGATRAELVRYGHSGEVSGDDDAGGRATRGSSVRLSVRARAAGAPRERREREQRREDPAPRRADAQPPPPPPLARRRTSRWRRADGVDVADAGLIVRVRTRFDVVSRGSRSGT